MEPPTKAVKRSLRELAAQAHEEDLRQALLPVSAAFDQWKAGILTSADIKEIIHKFHDGPARELFVRYNREQSFAVARAITRGVIPREEVPPAVLDYCRPAIEYFAAHKDEA